jgi:hypothetical protein
MLTVIKLIREYIIFKFPLYFLGGVKKVVGGVVGVVGENQTFYKNLIVVYIGKVWFLTTTPTTLNKTHNKNK